GKSGNGDAGNGGDGNGKAGNCKGGNGNSSDGRAVNPRAGNGRAVTGKVSNSVAGNGVAGNDQVAAGKGTDTNVTTAVGGAGEKKGNNQNSRARFLAKKDGKQTTPPVRTATGEGEPGNVAAARRVPGTCNTS
ncbi:unnamed protein product, partial [Pylaiella littoralis]